MVSLESALPDELVVNILSYTCVPDLVNFQSTCKRFYQLDTQAVWKFLCEKQIQHWHAYSHQDLVNKAPTWKGRFMWMCEDYNRTELSVEELERLEWSFGFLAGVGGHYVGDDLSPACFIQGNAYLLKYVWLHPLLGYQLVAPGIPGELEERVATVHGRFLTESLKIARKTGARCSKRQYIRIGKFPPHLCVARTSEGGWLVWNKMVVFTSDGRIRAAGVPPQVAEHRRLYSE